ncbi:HNH endonuclease [Priestia sp. RMT2NF4]|uniref:HNH endonuclease n=1 Tax=Priestia sp. RMT2NF4 TaxID=3398394 RepID=UPI003A4C5AC8
MKFNTICNRCGNLVTGSATNCPCKKTYRRGGDKTHPSSTRRFQKLRKSIIIRDEYHCQRCKAVYGQLIMGDLECHHIKSFRDYPELAYDEANLITVCRRCNLDLGNSNKLNFNWIASELKVPTL